MSGPKVVVADYGAGNLYSVCRALEALGAAVTLSDRPTAAAAADRLLVPGVGAFADCIEGLKRQGLEEPVRRHAEAGKPLLGICVGAQMLLDAGEEFGETPGLGMIPGRCVAIPATGADGAPHKMPHIGWAPLQASGDWQGTVLGRSRPGDAVYFVHSFHAEPANPEHLLATVDYNGRSIAAAIGRENVQGLQFHPERSARVGLDILSAWLAL